MKGHVLCFVHCGGAIKTHVYLDNMVCTSIMIRLFTKPVVLKFFMARTPNNFDPVGTLRNVHVYKNNQ